jgi:selenide,water dikinase
MEEIKLTQYSKGSGCGCKISPATLKEILHTNEEFPSDPRLWVGNESNDDAAVIEWNGNEGLIATTDFFMPMVDDPFAFGKIAAANALSDVYAMGGSPLMALAILGWPIDKLPVAHAQQVLEGARLVCRMAGVPLAGGHSIESAEPIFGLAVSGRIERSQLKRNNTAQAGDWLYLTKPLGAGIISAALKRGQLDDPAHIDAVVAYMSALNKIGEAFGRISGVHAMTDVTGFGFAGHLLELCEGSGLSAEVLMDELPVYPFLNDYIARHIYPDMTMKNYSYYAAKISTLSLPQLLLLCDPQTSGGILVSVAESSRHEVEACMHDFGLSAFAKPIGKMTTLGEKVITVC